MASWYVNHTVLCHGEELSLSCTKGSSCLSPSSPGMLSDYKIQKSLVLFRRFLRLPTVGEDGICRLTDLGICFIPLFISFP